jgi:hypothetical protein
MSCCPLSTESANETIYAKIHSRGLLRGRAYRALFAESHGRSEGSTPDNLGIEVISVTDVYRIVKQSYRTTEKKSYQITESRASLLRL